MTVTVLPDTMYTIGCVGYGEQGQELCVEGNTTITTRELRHNEALQMYACACIAHCNNYRPLRA